MPRKILVCVDKSTPGVYTAQWAFENVVKPEDEVILISAVKVQTHLAPSHGTTVTFDQVSSAVQHDLEGDVGRTLKYIAEQLQQREGQVKTVVVLGDPRDVVVDYVAQHGIDLVLTGSGSKGFFKRLALGSVSDYVMQHCPCTVIVVKEPQDADLE